MEGVEEVRQEGEKRLFWKAKIAGKVKEWEAEIPSGRIEGVLKRFRDYMEERGGETGGRRGQIGEGESPDLGLRPTAGSRSQGMAAQPYKAEAQVSQTTAETPARQTAGEATVEVPLSEEEGRWRRKKCEKELAFAYGHSCIHRVDNHRLYVVRRVRLLCLRASRASPSAAGAPHSSRAGASQDIRAGHARVDDAVRDFVRLLRDQPKLG
jgi:hypothetical protein